MEDYEKKPKTKKYTDEVIFCAKYLNQRGFLSEEHIEEIKALIEDFDVEFNFIKVEQSFYVELAKELRKLWPAGDKDDQWAWRDSVGNLARRLETLWAARNLGQYSIDDCLMCARRYLARYEDNTKYMQTLKYFILKQGKLKKPDGSVKYIQQSTFADMLESYSTTSEEQEDWTTAFEQSSTLMQGQLI